MTAPFSQLQSWGVLSDDTAPDFDAPITRRQLLTALCQCVYGITPYPDQSVLASGFGFTFSDIEDGTQDCSLAVNAAAVYHMLNGSYEEDSRFRTAGLDQTVTEEEAVLFTVRLLDWYTGGAGELARLHRQGFANACWTVAENLGLLQNRYDTDKSYGLAEEQKNQSLTLGQMTGLLHNLLLTELTIYDSGTVYSAYLLGEAVTRMDN